MKNLSVRGQRARSLVHDYHMTYTREFRDNILVVEYVDRTSLLVGFKQPLCKAMQAPISRIYTSLFKILNNFALNIEILHTVLTV